ncbi:AAA family ATPase [Candidatus Magnetaquicoccus inordinatus]|uniref:AAA family ATPase n=1 Tax=Candidatus Magnetaquicoccus inordinatus TaxID=2496818 RepID=UPI00187D0D18|nr:AAA family ATPase [Candidatus Magnetaquicoccus inordinatus]
MASRPKSTRQSGNKDKFSFRLKQLEINNFKGIDQIVLDFLPPRMRDDPDIYVMGSRNGIGKTSILEACSLLFLAALSGTRFAHGSEQDAFVRFSEMFVRSGSESADISGIFYINAEDVKFTIQLDKSGKISVGGDKEKIYKFFEPYRKRMYDDLTERFLTLLTGHYMEPVIMPPCLYFHSYRKVQEGKPELGMMLEHDMMFKRRIIRSPYSRMSIQSSENSYVSIFKLQILRAMMGRANLFDLLDSSDNADETFDKINNLIERYAGGTIDKLRPSTDNTLDFRITQKKGGVSFAFDGLSSGQKEIISTLFLIWHYSKDQPCLILIDEPELHLNAEWHRDFVQQVYQIAPENQYIFATHSNEMFSSVKDERRLFIGAKQITMMEKLQ